ncbi:PP2C family protein-serine/threonine phosphatase [Streptomyces sp. NPDC052042]|uniref:PP2C family protein-serine/threonine phosphatase n=1 Tax=Streptomyces sp. NPDC052042 TaxID=3365683 RepID=UPI0037D7BACE
MSHSGGVGGGEAGRSRRWRLRLGARTWAWWLPLLLIALDVAADLAARSREPLSFLLVGVPPVAATTRTPRRTAGFAALCLALEIWLASRRPGHIGEPHHLALYLSTAMIGLVGAWLAWQRLRAEANLVRARSVAEAMQLTLLRPLPERLGPVRAAGFYEAGERGTLVGGDLYDLCETRFGVRVVVGDVRGKGLDAVETVAAVLGSFRVWAHEWPDLSRLAEHLELSIARNSGHPTGDDELFVTALLLEFPPGGGSVRIVDRGHPEPLLLTAHGTRRLPTVPALPLGLGELGGEKAEITTHPLRTGEVVLLYTDGVSEARNTEGELYPLAERLAGRFGDGCGTPDPSALVSFLRADTEQWSTGAADDRAAIALVLLEVPEAGRPGGAAL